MRDFLEMVGMLGVALLFVFVVIFGVVGVMHSTVDRVACNASTRDMRLAHRFTFWGGCQVNTPREGWIPLEALRVVSPVER
jgi:hypothetical protein